MEVSLPQRSHLLRLPPGPHPFPPHHPADFRRGQCYVGPRFECRLEEASDSYADEGMRQADQQFLFR